MVDSSSICIGRLAMNRESASLGLSPSLDFGVSKAENGSLARLAVDTLEGPEARSFTMSIELRTVLCRLCYRTILAFILQSVPNSRTNIMMMIDNPLMSNRTALGGLFVLSILMLASGRPVEAQEVKTDGRYLIYVDGLT